MPCPECHHTECSCDCDTCEATRRAAARGILAPCDCHPCRRAREQTYELLRAALPPVPSSFEPVVTFTYNPEAADIDERIKLLRAASRPSELHTGPGSNGNFKEPTAQGNIMSAITKLERRRAELLGKVR